MQKPKEVIKNIKSDETKSLGNKKSLLSDNVKDMLVEVGVPLNIVFKEIKADKRKKRIRERRKNLKKQAREMAEFYHEDPELTEMTKCLESEDFHEY